MNLKVAYSQIQLEKERHSKHKAPGITCLFCSQLLHQENFLSVPEMCLFELPFPQTPLGIARFSNRPNFETLWKLDIREEKIEFKVLTTNAKPSKNVS